MQEGTTRSILARKSHTERQLGRPGYKQDNNIKTAFI